MTLEKLNRHINQAASCNDQDALASLLATSLMHLVSATDETELVSHRGRVMVEQNTASVIVHKDNAALIH